MNSYTLKIKLLLTSLLLLITHNISFTQDIDEIYKELHEYQKRTIAFVDNGIDYWKQVYMDKKYPLEKRLIVYENLLISPSFKRKSNKIAKIKKEITKLNKKNIHIFDEKAKHIVEIKIPFIHKNKTQEITFHFTKKEIEDKIYRWKLTHADYPPSISDDIKYRGLTELEVEKGFANFLDEIKNSHTILEYVDVHPSLLALAQDLLKNKISLNDYSYNVEMTYKLLDIPYGENPSRIRGYKYLIFKYYDTIESTKQTGWLIDEEGEMYTYFKKYNPNNPEAFYSELLDVDRIEQLLENKEVDKWVKFSRWFKKNFILLLTVNFILILSILGLGIFIGRNKLEALIGTIKNLKRKFKHTHLINKK